MKSVWSGRLAIAAAVVSPAGVAAALVPIRDRVDDTNVALILVAVMMAGLRWGVSRMGLPGKEVDLIVHGRGRPMGRFILVPTPGVPVAWDRRLVAVAMADQVGAALAASSDGLSVS